MRERDDVEAIRRALVDPVEVCRCLRLDAGAKRQARGLLVRCPAHDDRTPSCSVRLGADGTIAVKCHAGCGLAGDVYDLVAAVEGLDIRREFAAVLRRAAELAAFEGPTRSSTAHTPDLQPLADEAFAAVVAPWLCVGRLDDSPIAVDVSRYLAGRGLLEEARTDGWAALPHPECQASWRRVLLDAAEPSPGYAQPFTEADVSRSGILSRSGLPHPDNRLCIPWRNPSGVVANLQRRRLDDCEPRYVGARGRAFAWPYGVEWIGRVDQTVPVAFVEGAVDVLALRALCAAREEQVIVLGLPGLGGWRPRWAALARGRSAAIAVDADAAGERDVDRIATDLASAGAERVQRWSPPTKDWAAYLAARRAA
jgi:DNA primase